MASLEIRSFRNEDNSVSIVVLVPPRRNGEANFGAIARINRELLSVNPQSFDPVEVGAPSLADLETDPALLAKLERAEADDPHVGDLTAEQAYRDHGDGTP